MAKQSDPEPYISKRINKSAMKSDSKLLQKMRLWLIKWQANVHTQSLWLTSNIKLNDLGDVITEKKVFHVKTRRMPFSSIQIRKGKREYLNKIYSLCHSKVALRHKCHRWLQLWGLGKRAFKEQTFCFYKVGLKPVLGFLSFHSLIVCSPKVSRQRRCVCVCAWPCEELHTSIRVA